MRSVTVPIPQRDGGAVLVWVAICMVVLLGMAALVIDFGALYSERRQLQNGADAAALAVAQDCAEDATTCAGAFGNPTATAATFANRNARDGLSGLDGVCGSGSPALAGCATPPAVPAGVSGWVRVSTSTLEPGGGTEVPFTFARVLGLDGDTVHASAVAAWGPASRGTVAPFVFSACEWLAVGGTLTGGGTVPSGIRRVYWHGKNRNDPVASTCRPSPSGQDLPGGFGRVVGPGCTATIVVGAWAPEDPGNDMVKDCPYESWKNQEIAIAVYDQTRGSGSNGEYHIVALTGFKVLGYRWNGNRTWSGSPSCPVVGPASVTYVCGQFTTISFTNGGIGGPDFGGRTIQMIG